MMMMMMMMIWMHMMMMMMMHPRPHVLEGSAPWHQFYVYDLACFTDLLFTGTLGCHQFYVYDIACFMEVLLPAGDRASLCVPLLLDWAARGKVVHGKAFTVVDVTVAARCCGLMC